MKINKNFKKSNRFFKLQLIKFKIYKEQKNIKNIEMGSCLNHKIINLKKALRLIFKYVGNKKLVWFFNSSTTLGKGFVKDSKDNLMFSKDFKYRNLSLNKGVVQKLLLNDSKAFSKLSQFKKYNQRPDLVVLFSSIGQEDKHVVRQCNDLRIPLINFTSVNIEAEQKFKLNYDVILQKPILGDLALILTNAVLSRLR